MIGWFDYFIIRCLVYLWFDDSMNWWFNDSMLWSIWYIFFIPYLFFLSLKYKTLCKKEHCSWLNSLEINSVWVKSQSYPMVYIEGAFFNKNIRYLIKYIWISRLNQYFSQCTLHRHQDKAADGRSFSKRKRLWFVTIVQYINQSWIYCEKWNSPAAPQQLRLGLLRRLHLHLRLRRPSSLFDLQHSVFSLQSRFFSLQSPVFGLVNVCSGREWRCVWVA